MAVRYGKGHIQDGDLDQREPFMGVGAGIGLLVNHSLQPSLWLLSYDRTRQGWTSGSGRSGLRRAGRPNTAGRLLLWIETPKFTPRSSWKVITSPGGGRSVFSD